MSDQIGTEIKDLAEAVRIVEDAYTIDTLMATLLVQGALAVTRQEGENLNPDVLANINTIVDVWLKRAEVSANRLIAAHAAADKMLGIL